MKVIFNHVATKLGYRKVNKEKKIINTQLPCTNTMSELSIHYLRTLPNIDTKGQFYFCWPIAMVHIMHM